MPFPLPFFRNEVVHDISSLPSLSHALHNAAPKYISSLTFQGSLNMLLPEHFIWFFSCVLEVLPTATVLTCRDLVHQSVPRYLISNKAFPDIHATVFSSSDESCIITRALTFDKTFFYHTYLCRTYSLLNDKLF